MTEHKTHYIAISGGALMGLDIIKILRSIMFTLGVVRRWPVALRPHPVMTNIALQSLHHCHNIKITTQAAKPHHSAVVHFL